MRGCVGPVRGHVVFFSLGLGLAALVASGRSAAPGDDLYRQFRNPPRECGLMPYWFWNGKITAAETSRQMRLMLEQGVSSAIVFPWDGMEIPYLSEAWWQTLGSALDTARELGFTLNLNDELTWPSGHARDPYQQGPELSRVLATCPQYRLRTLALELTCLQGPRTWRHTLAQAAEVIVAGRRNADDTLDPDSMRLVEANDGALEGTVSWNVPPGRWDIFVYTAREVVGAHNTRVDLLNSDAVAKYIELVYEPLARRFPHHLGTTLRLTSADHEGTYGVHPILTPRLWEVFQARCGYDLRPMLPLLRQQGGRRSDQVRCDYFDVIAWMYRTTFVERVTKWCAAHGVQHMASFYEEQLWYQVNLAGDMPALWRTTSAVEIDALLERARMPIDFKEAVSVAHFEGKKLMVENQGLQGHDSFLSPEKMRLGSNMALLWGADVLIPYFEYDPRKVQWPPQWFPGQPFQKYFHHYAAYVRRVSYLNSRGTHVAPILLYYPLASAWANAARMFAPGQRELDWGNAMDDIQAIYSALQLQLSRHGWDYHIADAHYLNQAAIKGPALSLADEHFSVVILPPLTTISQPAMQQLATLFDAGGKIIAVGQLPTGSPEAGANDPVVEDLVQHVFGPDAVAGRKAVNRHPGGVRGSGGGVAHFFPCKQPSHFMNVLRYSDQIEVPDEIQRSLQPVLKILEQTLRREVEVIRGQGAGIYAAHRFEGETHFYWVVNDSERPRDVTIRLTQSGNAQQWDPLTGDRITPPFRATDRGTEVDLRLEPWGGTYVIIAPPVAGLPRQQWTEIVESRDLTGGRWRFTPATSEIRVPYASIRTAATGAGEAAGFHQPAAAGSGWRDQWLSVERLANRSWWMIGPFPYGDHEGYNRLFPPEKEIRLERKYVGELGAEVGWTFKTSPTYWVNLRQLLNLPAPANSVAYALSYVYSPTDREGQIRVAFADSIKLWWNGRQEMAVHRHPKWMLLRDPWAESATVTIRKGWNRVLLKVCRSENRPISFLLRIADARGNTLRDLVFARAADDAHRVRHVEGEKWYRVDAPPGTHAVVVPEFESLQQVYVNGSKVAGVAGARIDLPPGPGATVLFRCGPDERLEQPIRFIAGTTEFGPGSWTGTTLAHYSGTATYETDFDLPKLEPDTMAHLDCGQVGVTAEIWINGGKVGERVWRPFVFDMTEHVRKGTNTLKITVANSGSNWQAQGDPIYPIGSWGLKIKSQREMLSKIEPSGLVGPVRVLILRQSSRSR